MAESEDERESVIEPPRRADDRAVLFGVQALRIIGSILVAYVVLHFLIKYW
jgi:hypothetical protein